MSLLVLLLVTYAPIQDAGTIAFVSRRDGSSQVYLMNSDGTDVRKLTANSGTAYTPAISPDGRRVAFVSDHEGSHQIYLIDTDGSSQLRLTSYHTYAEEPSWSPDGRLVYSRAGLDDGTVAVFNIDTTGGNPRQVTGNSLRYKEPSVSPDSRRMVFNNTRNGSAEVWVMDIDGQNARRVPYTPNWGMAPEWAPGGDRIAYGLLDPSKFSAWIHVVNADGSGDVELFDSGEYPCWSPDGYRIAFQTDRDGNFQIYVMNADGTEVQRLTQNEAFDGRPSWGGIASPTLPYGVGPETGGPRDRE